MADKLYCIIDTTADDKSVAYNNLVDLTLEQANEWLTANQITLDHETEGSSFKFRMEPHNQLDYVEVKYN